MREAELRARRGEVNLTSNKDIDEKISNEHSDLEPLPGVKLNIWNAIIPIGILIVGSLFAFYYSGYTTIMSGEDTSLIQIFNNSPLSFVAIREAFSNADASVALFQSALFAGVVAIAMGVGKKIFTVSQGLEMWVDGMKTLVITCVILICAWSLSSVIKELGTAKIFNTTIIRFCTSIFITKYNIYTRWGNIICNRNILWNNGNINATYYTTCSFNKS